MTNVDIRQSDNYKKYFDRSKGIHPLVLYFYLYRGIYNSSEIARLAIYDRYVSSMKSHKSIKSCSLNWKSDCRILSNGI